MEFVGANYKMDDCMIVALHNACVALGRKSTYQKIINLSTKKGWYVEGSGFLIQFLDQAFEELSLSADLVEICPRTIWNSCFGKGKIYLFFRPSDNGDCPGHVMVATKSEKGVKIHNPYVGGTGWRTLHRAIIQGEKYIAIEVSKS